MNDFANIGFTLLFYDNIYIYYFNIILFETFKADKYKADKEGKYEFSTSVGAPEC